MNIDSKLFNLSAEKAKEVCQEHGVNLTVCPATNCTGCYFTSCCNNKTYCSKCADNLLKSMSEGSQRIKQNELSPILKDIKNQKTNLSNLEESLDILENKASLRGVELRNKIDETKDELKRLEFQRKEVEARLR